MDELKGAIAQARESFEQQRQVEAGSRSRLGLKNRRSALGANLTRRAAQSNEDVSEKAAAGNYGSITGAKTGDVIGLNRRIDASRRALEAKAARYERLVAAASASRNDELIDSSLNDDEVEEGLVDFDAKHLSPATEDALDTDDLVETTDEFGRTRLVPSTAANSTLKGRRERLKAVQERFRPAQVIRDATYMPTFNIDEDFVRDLNENDDYVERVHYDASREIRDRGVGFYQFSLEEEQRERELQELAAHRRATELAQMDEGPLVRTRREREARREALRARRQEILGERLLNEIMSPENNTV